MRRKRHAAIKTFLGPDVVVEGDLTFEGGIRIDGRFNGTIASREGRVIVGEKAVVEAQIQVDQVVIAGTVRGYVKATRSLDIKKTGEVVGDIEAPVVTIEPGTVLQGSCDTKRGDTTDKTVSLAAKKNAKAGTAGAE